MSNAIVTQRDTQLEKQRAGYIKLSLTNFSTSSEPAIAAGSVVEISGSLYSFTVDEAITGWSALSAGDAYIKLVPDGTDPCTAEFTDVAPTWSDGKQGWYDATGTDRYVAGLNKVDASTYRDKFIYDNTMRTNYGAIGTYVICASIAMNTNTSYGVGDTFDGSTLRVSNETSITSNAYSLSSSSDEKMFISSGDYVSLGLVGTWTLMCRVRKGSIVTVYPVGLFLRTS